MFKYRGVELANRGVSKSRKRVYIILHIANIKWKIALSAYSGRNRNKTKWWNKARMSEEGCTGCPFHFLVARVVTGGWLCCEDEMAERHFSLSLIYSNLQKFPSKSWALAAKANAPHRKAKSCPTCLAAQWWLAQPSVPPHPIACPGESTHVTFLEELVKPSRDGGVWGQREMQPRHQGQFSSISLRDKHTWTPVGADAW